MKKALILTVSVLCMVLMASCGGGRKIDVNAEKAQEAIEKMKGAADEAGVEFDKEKLYVPEILIKNNENFDIDVYRNNGVLANISISFRQPDGNYIHINNYKVDELNVTIYDEKPTLPEYITKLKRKKGSNEFYIYESGSQIMMFYYINKYTLFYLSASIEETEMTQKLAEQIYDDFQVISLAELEKISKK